MRLIRASAAVAVMLCGCQLVPNQPEAVFVLYRDRMKTQNLDEARSLLSNDSRRLALELAAEHKLQQSPESLALLNALDPTAAPGGHEIGRNVCFVAAKNTQGRTETSPPDPKGSQFSLEDRHVRGTAISSVFSRSTRDSGHDPRAGG